MPEPSPGARCSSCVALDEPIQPHCLVWTKDIVEKMLNIPMQLCISGEDGQTITLCVQSNLICTAFFFPSCRVILFSRGLHRGEIWRWGLAQNRLVTVNVGYQIHFPLQHFPLHTHKPERKQKGRERTTRSGIWQPFKRQLFTFSYLHFRQAN